MLQVLAGPRVIMRAVAVVLALGVPFSVAGCSASRAIDIEPGSAETGAVSPRDATDPTAPSVPADLDTTVLMLDFDGGDDGPEPVSFPVATGGTATVQTSGQGRVELVPDAGQGRAIRFPAPCEAEEKTCPRAIVELPDAPELNPGRHAFLFGAGVLLDPDQTSVGSNVVQKGFSTGGLGQWKLQIDDLEGRPSCLIVGTGSEEVHEAESEVGVADGRWHEVLCLRDGQLLSIWVDGRQVGSAALPSGVIVVNEAPVRIGGKNVKQDNDQYFGAVDRVVVRRGD